MLASIQKIESLTPIPGADRIETARVLGWDCIVRKGEFQVGDLCIYIETDTIIPKQLLDETYEGDEQVRLKVIKMKKQISQGLVLKLMGTKYQTRVGDESEECFDIGRDVSELLGVKKYVKEIPASMQGLIKGNFPSFIPKTDEVRIQGEMELLDLLRGKPYYITQKLDGTSGTFYKYNGVFGVCSRNMELKPGENVYWRMAEKYHIDEWLPDGYAIQGEICGPSIQGNKLGLEEVEMFIFNIYNISEHRYEPFDFISGFILYHGNEREFVPILKIDDDGFYLTLEELLAMATSGKYPNGTPQEGIVVRAIDQSISFKVINPEFCLKYGE